MNDVGSTPLRPFLVPPYPPGEPLSPLASLASARDDTLHLLFQPFEARRWLRLSALCLFLGGGSSTAAFQWGFSALPGELHPAHILLRARIILAQHVSLMVLAALLGVGVAVALLYVRCVFRFLLVDAILARRLSLRAAWKRLEPFGRAYFWLLMEVFCVLILLAAGMAVAFLSLTDSTTGVKSLPSPLLILVLAAIVLTGLLLAVAITLTDDLVVPIAYAEHISFPAAWKKIWNVGQREAGTFVYYLALRFAMSFLIGVGVLAFLFPVLTGLSSGPLIAAAVTVAFLRLVGLSWTWNFATITLGILALLLLTGAIFILLSVAGMPGQVYLQTLGVRFIGPRSPALAALSRASESSARRW